MYLLSNDGNDFVSSSFNVVKYTFYICCMTADRVDTIADEVFFATIINDNRKAFEQLFRKYDGSMCHYAATYLKIGEEVEDTIQDIFIYLWNNCSTVKGRTPLKVYFFCL